MPNDSTVLHHAQRDRTYRHQDANTAEVTGAEMEVTVAVAAELEVTGGEAVAMAGVEASRVK